MAEHDYPQVVDGYGNSVRLDENGLVVTAAPGKDLELNTSGGGTPKANGVPIGGGVVASVFGRVGTVVAVATDYGNVPNLSLGNGDSDLLFDVTGTLTLTGGLLGAKLAFIPGEVFIQDDNTPPGSLSISGGDITLASASPAETLELFTGQGVVINLQAGSVFSIYDTASTASGLQIFANNAAALAGGLIAGNFYRTGADPDVVCTVH